MGSPAGWTAVSEAPPAANGWTAVDETPPRSSEEGGFFSHLGSTLASAPGAIVQTVAHPLDALKNWRDQSQALHDAAVDSAQQGDYQAAAVHGLNFLANVIPGLGKVMDDAASAKTPEEFKAKLGDVVGSALLMKAGEKAPGVVKGAADKIGGAVDVVTNPDVVRAGVKVLPKGPAAVSLYDAIQKARGKAGPELPAKVPPPAADPAAAPAAAAPPAPPSPAPLPISRQLPAGPIVTPAPADTSGVIPGWKPTILENENAPAAAPPAAPAPDLDGVAQGFGFKDFASVKDPRAAATIQRVAAQAVAPNPAKTAFDASRTPPPPEAAPPAAPAPTPPPPAAPAAPTAVAPAIENPGAAAFAARARAPKVSTLADTLHQGDISADDAARLTPGDWQRLSRGLGINNPSPYTINAVLDELRSREAAADMAKSQEGVQRAADLRSRAEAARRAKLAPAPPQ